MHTLLLLGLLVTADETKDTANIQGTWVVVSVLKDGKDDDELKGDRLTFKDGMLRIKGEKKDEKGTYRLDSSKKPKTIDVTHEGADKPIAGIYVLEGDRLTVCIIPQPGEKRPTDLSGKAGTGQMLVELKREKK